MVTSQERTIKMTKQEEGKTGVMAAVEKVAGQPGLPQEESCRVRVVEVPLAEEADLLSRTAHGKRLLDNQACLRRRVATFKSWRYPWLRR